MSKFLNIISVGALILSLGATSMARTQVESEDIDVNGKQTKAYVKEANNGLDMRKSRRLGVGLQAAGALGIGGALIDLNFNPNWGFTAGFGGGEGFQAFMFQGKYVMAGDWLMPYFSFGFANWSSVGKSGPISKTTPSILGDKLLTSEEKADGQYRKNLIYPGFGLQFMQLNGEWAGFSVLAELTALVDIGSFTAAPTGTLGVLYYF